MIKRILFLTLLLHMCSSVLSAQVNWRMYTNLNDIQDMALHENYLWCATSGGIVRWDTNDMTFRTYTTLNGLPSNYIISIAVEPNGRVWCGTHDDGIACFDGNSWITYNTDNGLQNNYVRSIAVGSYGTI